VTMRTGSDRRRSPTRAGISNVAQKGAMRRRPLERGFSEALEWKTGLLYGSAAGDVGLKAENESDVPVQSVTVSWLFCFLRILQLRVRCRDLRREADLYLWSFTAQPSC
jgi:hypothetical protein